MNYFVIGVIVLTAPVWLFLIAFFSFIVFACLCCMWGTLFAIFGYRGLERFCVKQFPDLYGKPFPNFRKEK